MTYKFYVFSPYFVTGGPEALHQLASAIRDLGHECYLWYIENKYNNQIEKPVISQYSHYNVVTSTDYFLEDIDKEDCIWIVPESFGLNFYEKKRKAKLIIWYLATVTGNYRAVSYPVAIAATNLLLAQSEWGYDQARAACSTGRTCVRHLGDYTRLDLLLPEEALEREARIDQVLYNPAKGMEHTAQIRRRLPDIRFVALQGMTQTMILDAGLKSKLYIDFGHHPGKDRLPREMAVLGAAVMTGSDNVASSDIDVPIGKLKMQRGDDGKYDYDEIADCIRAVLDTYPQSFKDLKGYRNVIRQERQVFFDQVQGLLDFIQYHPL